MKYIHLVNLLLFISTIAFSQTKILDENNNKTPITYYNGNIGIGTTNPDATLHIKGGIAIQNPHLSYDTSGNAGERAGIIFGTNNDTNNSMFWISSDAEVGDRLNIGCGAGYNDSQSNITMLWNGFLGIGTRSPTCKLEVAGTIKAEEILVEAKTADFVFDENYKLRSLVETEKYIKANRHLPDIPSAEKFEKSGINLAEMNKLLLQKIEELTLYLVEQDKKLKIKSDTINRLDDKLEIQTQMLNSNLQAIQQLTLDINNIKSKLSNN